jgi:hypothetical protein
VQFVREFFDGRKHVFVPSARTLHPDKSGGIRLRWFIAAQL